MKTPPRYTLTRQAFWVSFVLAWGVILVVVGYAVAGRDLAVSVGAIVVPSMVLLIAALLGIHRAFGSVDLRTQSWQDYSPPGSYYQPRARNPPPGVDEEAGG